MPAPMHILKAKNTTDGINDQAPRAFNRGGKLKSDTLLNNGNMQKKIFIIP